MAEQFQHNNHMFPHQQTDYHAKFGNSVLQMSVNNGELNKFGLISYAFGCGWHDQQRKWITFSWIYYRDINFTSVLIG